MERKIYEHRERVEATLMKGKELTRENQLAPDIVTDQVETLHRLWKRVSELAVNRKKDLEGYLEQYKSYVEELEKIMGTLSEKESVLNRKESIVNVWSEENAEEKIAEYKVSLFRADFMLLLGFLLAFFQHALIQCQSLKDFQLIKSSMHSRSITNKMLRATVCR